MNTPYRPKPSFPRGPQRGFRREQPKEKHRINRFIVAREVRVVTESGEQLGVLQTRVALQKAEEMGLDLVEVAATANPPVCRIMDYGKFKYKEHKKEVQARKNRSDNAIKELRIRYRTDSGDLETKLKHAREFLEEGDKVKFSMRFKGRESMYVDLGREKLAIIKQRLADIAKVEEESPLISSTLAVTFAPLK